MICMKRFCFVRKRRQKDGELKRLSFFVRVSKSRLLRGCVSVKELSMAKKLTLSALTVALYTAVMMGTRAFAFGQYQVRIATALYALSGIYPFLTVPLGFANFLSNALMGGLGPLDMAGGVTVGLATAGIIAAARNSRWNALTAFLAITLIPGLGVPVWLSWILHIPYWTLVPGLLAGQAVCGLCGALLLLALRRRLR